MYLTSFCEHNALLDVPAINPQCLEGRWVLKLINGKQVPAEVSYEWVIDGTEYSVTRRYNDEQSSRRGRVDAALISSFSNTPDADQQGATAAPIRPGWTRLGNFLLWDGGASHP